MRAYIYFPLFAIFLIFFLVQWLRFESHEKYKYHERYVSLYRRHHLIMIIILLVLSVDNGISFFNQLLH